MIRGVICPRERTANAATGKDFLTDIKITTYEVISDDRISESMLIVTTMIHALEDAKTTFISQVSLDQRIIMSALKTWIREASNVLSGLFEGQVPMQISSTRDHDEKDKNDKDKTKKDNDKWK